jgi:hypothetical protein
MPRTKLADYARWFASRDGQARAKALMAKERTVIGRFKGQRDDFGHDRPAVLISKDLKRAHPEGLRQCCLRQAEPDSGLLELSRPHGLSFPLDSR